MNKKFKLGIIVYGLASFNIESWAADDGKGFSLRPGSTLGKSGPKTVIQVDKETTPQLHKKAQTTKKSENWQHGNLLKVEVNGIKLLPKPSVDRNTISFFYADTRGQIDESKEHFTVATKPNHPTTAVHVTLPQTTTAEHESIRWAYICLAGNKPQFKGKVGRAQDFKTQKELGTSSAHDQYSNEVEAFCKSLWEALEG